MRSTQAPAIARWSVPLFLVLTFPSFGADPAPVIRSLSKPLAGDMQMIFHAGNGPFQIQERLSLDPNASWVDVPTAHVVNLGPGVFQAFIPTGLESLGMYRVVSQNDGILDLNGWTVLVNVSAPSNGVYFVAGESPVVTVSILDTLDQSLTTDSFSVLNLYMYGPQDPLQTTTAVALLNANTNRAVQPHHYIDLKSNSAVQPSGNQLTYRLQPVTTEAPGSYRVSVWAVIAADPAQQIMKFADLQIGTNRVEAPVVAKVKCAVCHEGPISGKTYMHHIDPAGTYFPKGNWALDYEPVRSCKSCHNNNGYSAYSDTNAPGGKVPDPIVRRVHGVHMGTGLKLPFNTNSVNGDFKDYVHVQFPADVRDCTKCHLDDRWKTQPSRMACGACHDNTWFGVATATPTGMVAHPGGTQNDDSNCFFCHPPDGAPNGLLHSISWSHQINPPAFSNIVELAMSPPANGQYYLNGEAPQVTIRIKDANTGTIINPTNIVEPLVRTNVQPNEWLRANLYVSGPRKRTVPVLTTAAAKVDPNQFYADNDFRVRTNPANEDPRVTRTANSVVYQLSTITNLDPGTYTAFVEVMPNKPLGGWAYTNFQVGSATAEPMVATNCKDCHGDTRRHTEFFSVTFDPDICKSCHDYLRQTPGKVGWANANNGFGAAPLSHRVHGVHYGNYLDKPVEVSPIVTSYDFSHVIFPQDVRNCTKCHAQTDSWTEKPSRLTCLGCHDTDAAIAHATLMTLDPTPADPWSGDEVESCEICHGGDDEFSPKKAHAISNPYVPPYPRAPRP